MALSRGARFILTFVLLAVTISVGGVLAMYFIATRGPEVRSRSVLWLRVPSNLTEHASNDIVGQLWPSRRNTVGSVVETLRKAKVDDRVESVVLIPPFQGGLWGKLQEVRDAVLEFKESGKPIVAYLEYGSVQQYYLASAADEIYLTPTSPLDLIGVASYELFLRDALDKAGIHPDMLHAGEFKTAANLYTEATFTPEHREMSESLNRDLYEQLVAGIAVGRAIPEADVRRAIDEGPFLPGDAVDRGLVDGLLYEDELLDRIADGDSLHPVSYRDYQQLDAASLGLGRGPQVAVIYAVGPINFGGSGSDVVGTDVVGSQTMARAIRDARDNDAIRAIVLRIDSPGGAAIAADIIWREVELASQEKPVVASMSDVAASGGYYIAAPADAVVAQPGTLTGSIGVVAGKLAYGGTLDKVGINIEAVTDGTVAEMYSPFSPFSAETRSRLQLQIDAIYETFLARVADGRQMTRDEVDRVGQGRVWSGRQAKDLGLVDELGGLQQALAVAKERSGLDPDQEVTVVPYPRPRSFFEVLNSEFSVRASLTRWLASPADRLRDAVTLPLRLYRPGEPLALMPLPPLPVGR